MKTLVGINNLTEVNQLAYANHIQFFYRLGKNYPSDYFALCNPRRMSIDNMRNFCAKVAIEGNYDYLLFIDDDVLVPFDCFATLVSADKDIVSGVTLIRGYPFHPMLFSKNGFIDNYTELAGEDGLVECEAVGFSLCLIKVSLLKAMKAAVETKFPEGPERNVPYFHTGQHYTEDIFFCRRAAEDVPGTTIYGQTRLLTAHILGPEIVHPLTRDARMIYEESTKEVS